MSSLLANLELSDAVFLGFLTVVGVSSILLSGRKPDNSRRLERKLDALLKHHGIELPSGISPDVQKIARDPTRKIEAIKLHREDHPGLGLADAKKDIEEFIRNAK